MAGIWFDQTHSKTGYADCTPAGIPTPTTPIIISSCVCSLAHEPNFSTLMFERENP